MPRLSSGYLDGTSESAKRHARICNAEIAARPELAAGSPDEPGTRWIKVKDVVARIRRTYPDSCNYYVTQVFDERPGAGWRNTTDAGGTPIRYLSSLLDNRHLTAVQFKLSDRGGRVCFPDYRRDELETIFRWEVGDTLEVHANQGRREALTANSDTKRNAVGRHETHFSVTPGRLPGVTLFR
jgi:hypothetical protein